MEEFDIRSCKNCNVFVKSNCWEQTDINRHKKIENQTIGSSKNPFFLHNSVDLSHFISKMFRISFKMT